MTLFDRPKYLRQRWGDYSLDFKLFFVWEFSLFTLIPLSWSGVFDKLSNIIFYGSASVWLALLVLIAFINRAATNWKWPGISALGAVGVLLGGVLMAAFLFVFLHGLLPVRHNTAPSVAFALSIVVFNLLSSANLVQSTTVEFARACLDDANVPKRVTADDKPVDPGWMRALRCAFQVISILVWVEAMAFFYVHEHFVDEGTLHPTETRTQYVNEHGTSVYFTDVQMRIHSLLERIMMIGISSMIAGGLVLHFVIGVPMFSNMPASRGLFGRSDDSRSDLDRAES